MIFIMAIKKTSNFDIFTMLSVLMWDYREKSMSHQESIFMHPQIPSTQMESLNSHLSSSKWHVHLVNCNSELKISMLSYY